MENKLAVIQTGDISIKWHCLRMIYCIEQKCCYSPFYLRSFVLLWKVRFSETLAVVLLEEPLPPSCAESILFLSGVWLDAFNLNEPFPPRPFCCPKRSQPTYRSAHLLGVLSTFFLVGAPQPFLFVIAKID